MSYRKKVQANVTPHLPPGENFVAAFPAMGGWIVGMAQYYRVVAVTDRRVHLYTAAWFSVCKPKRYIASLPPGAILVSHRRLNYQFVHVAGERLWVKIAHWKELREAVAASESAAVHR